MQRLEQHLTPERWFSSLQYGLRILRVRDWWDKIVHLLGAAFLYWLELPAPSLEAETLGVVAVAFVCLLIGGYTINDAADYPQDVRVPAGARPVCTSPRACKRCALVALGAGTILIFVAVPEPLPRAIAVATILLGVLYSLPPFRFKERGVLGVLVGAVTQKPALFLVLVAMAGHWNWIAGVLTLWLLAGGVLGMLGHQIQDVRNDWSVGVRTFVTSHGSDLALRLCIVCAAAIFLLSFSPFLFVSFTEGIDIVFGLCLLSSIYGVKGLTALRRMSS